MYRTVSSVGRYVSSVEGGVSFEKEGVGSVETGEWYKKCVEWCS